MRKIDEFMMKAKDGDSEAQYRLGKCYLNGIGIEKNEEEAFKWFRKSAEQNDPKGQCALGACYYNGVGVEKGGDEGIRLFILSAEQNWPLALFNLGTAYMEGKYLERNVTEGERFYIMAALLGDEDAMLKLGHLYFYNKEFKDEKLALKWFFKSAEKDHKAAQFWLYWYHIEYLYRENHEEGIKWLKKAAINGHPVAQYALATKYEWGLHGVRKDSKRAFKWYFISDRRGVIEATERLYVFYCNGKGVKRDLQKAFDKCYRVYQCKDDNFKIHNELAYLSLELGHHINYVKACHQVSIAHFPLDPDCRDTNGCILLKEGKIDEALKDFEYCLAMDNKRGVFHEHLGDAHIAKDEKEKALACYEEALGLVKYDFEQERIKEKIGNLKEAANAGNS